MGRNLERRVELMIPVEDSRARRRILRLLEAFFQDNTQASKILPDGSSERLKPAPGEKKFRAQEHFFKEARRTAKAREQERAMTFEPHVPK
jgi:polyphosphate kinase